MQQLTVRDLRDLLERLANILGADGYVKDVHLDVLREVQEVRILVDRVVGGSHMGCALDEVLLVDGEDSEPHTHRTPGGALVAGVQGLYPQHDSNRSDNWLPRQFRGNVK